MAIEREPQGLPADERARIAVDQAVFGPLRKAQPDLYENGTTVFALDVDTNGKVDTIQYLDALASRMGKGEMKPQTTDLGKVLAESLEKHAKEHPARTQPPKVTPYF
jgi:hypothetical protein